MFSNGGTAACAGRSSRSVRLPQEEGKVLGEGPRSACEQLTSCQQHHG